MYIICFMYIVLLFVLGNMAEADLGNSIKNGMMYLQDQIDKVYIITITLLQILYYMLYRLTSICLVYIAMFTLLFNCTFDRLI